jgi:outer membrane lipase/esterase
MSLLNLPVRAWLRVALSAAAPLVLLATAGCDSSRRVETYVPTRIMSFGDDLSTIEADGRKYTINGFVVGSTTTLDCTVNPIWNQTLAINFGLAFNECQPSSIATANGVMGAAAGANVDVVDAQIAAAQASSTAMFVPTTLVTIQGGMHDVLAAYSAFKMTANRDAAFQLLADKGAKLAAAVNRVTANGAGPRVIYDTVPDLGFSPLAIIDQANNAASTVCLINCRTLLSQLTAAFNSVMRTGVYRRDDGVTFTVGTGVINDGRYAALVAVDDTLRSMADIRFSVVPYGLLNNTTAIAVAACTVTDLRLCLPTSATLVAEAAAAVNPSFAYLWASDRLPGPNWHNRVATVAITRARNNPF